MMSKVRLVFHSSLIIPTSSFPLQSNWYVATLVGVS